MYSKKYFEGDIFDTNYHALADAIIAEYQPKTVFEIGCGKGLLSKALAKKNIEIAAVDGFSSPDFRENDNISFSNLDLNNIEMSEQYFSKYSKKFDLVICLEIAEHLKPETSPYLIKWLTNLSDTVVFSAAVPGQGGEGHINCQTKDYWHQHFLKQRFFIKDNIRKHIRNNKTVAHWYRYNITDYSRFTPTTEECCDIIERLMASESNIASGFYESQNHIEKQQYKLNLFFVKQFLLFRNSIKKLFGRPILK